MAENTKIEWTTSTWNPWRGCTRVSEGCRHCYAETLAKRNPRVFGVWGPQGTRVLASEATWQEPLKWDRQAAASGEPWYVFCASLADVFEDWRGPILDAHGGVYWAPPHSVQLPPFPVAAHQDSGAAASLEAMGGRRLTMDDLRRDLFALIDQTPNLTWQLLTKRPENILSMVPPDWLHDWPANVWAMTSVEDQETADRRIPELLKVPARARGLSVEPLLGPVDLSRWLDVQTVRSTDQSQAGRNRLIEQTVITNAGLHWVIVGGESGPHARPCHEEWERDLIRQCLDTGASVFRKQAGSNSYRDGQRVRYHDPKGGDPSEWAEDLRIRQMPT